MGKRHATGASRRKGLNRSRDKNARDGWGGEGESLRCDPGSELRLHRRERERRVKTTHRAKKIKRPILGSGAFHNGEGAKRVHHHFRKALNQVFFPKHPLPAFPLRKNRALTRTNAPLCKTKALYGARSHPGPKDDCNSSRVRRAAAAAAAAVRRHV